MLTVCEVFALCLVLIVLLILFFTFVPRPAPTPAHVLAQLRAKMLQAPTLRQWHPDVLQALRSWRLVPSEEMSHADFANQTLHIVVGLPCGMHYDADTLTLVLTHELVHAALGPRESHDAAFFAKEKACIAALTEDGLISRNALPNPMYPAQILEPKDS